MISWLDYTPHLAKQKIESPIKWEEPSGDEEDEDDEDDDSDDTADSDAISRTNLSDSGEISPVQRLGPVEISNEKRAPKADVTRVQVTEEEKDAGCKCVIV